MPKPDEFLFSLPPPPFSGDIAPTFNANVDFTGNFNRLDSLVPPP